VPCDRPGIDDGCEADALCSIGSGETTAEVRRARTGEGGVAGTEVVDCWLSEPGGAPATLPAKVSALTPRSPARFSSASLDDEDGEEADADTAAGNAPDLGSGVLDSERQNTGASDFFTGFLLAAAAAARRAGGVRSPALALAVALALGEAAVFSSPAPAAVDEAAGRRCRFWCVMTLAALAVISASAPPSLRFVPWARGVPGSGGMTMGGDAALAVDELAGAAADAVAWVGDTLLSWAPFGVSGATA
jgi:hypothetical protein